MINFNSYSGDPFELYKDAVDRKLDGSTKEQLENIEDKVEKSYQKYGTEFKNHQVHLIEEDSSYSDADKDLLQSLYGSKKTVIKEIRQWIDAHNKRTYLRRCPYCTINTANTTEHILPKKKYPEYAIHALNLLPCCSECNSDKGEYVKTDDGKPYIINFYYDILPEKQYLFVDVSMDVNGVPNFDYRLENLNNIGNDLFDLICRHFRLFGLLERYKTEAINIYTEIENELLEDLEEHDDIDKCLGKLKNKALRDAKEYGRNHWKVVLKIALADSEEYKKYLMKKNGIIVKK